MRKTIILIIIGILLGSVFTSSISTKNPDPAIIFENSSEKAGDTLLENRETTHTLSYHQEYDFFPEDPRNISYDRLEKDKVTALAKEFAKGEFLVKLTPDTVLRTSKTRDESIQTDLPSLDVLNQKYHVSRIERLFNTSKNTDKDNSFLYNIFKFYVPEMSDIKMIVEEYAKDSYILYAEPNYIYHTCATPNDSYFNYQWALHQSSDHDIDAPEAWDIETGDSDVIIAIVDTGVDYTHPDLAGNCIAGYDFANNDNDPMDDNGHGTHCAGITAAVTNNNIGVAGVCWHSKIMPVKAIDYKGDGYTDKFSYAIQYAVDHGAKVISISWASHDKYCNVMRDAVDYAYAKGSVLVAAAGNFNNSVRCYPAAYEHVIAVAGTNQNDQRCTENHFDPRHQQNGDQGSNYGSWVDVAAPGANIYSTYLGNSYAYKSGTSMSCPFVAGLVGLILSKNNGLNQEQVRTIIRSTTDTVNSSEYIGVGRINAYKALLQDSTVIATLNASLDDAVVKEPPLTIKGTAMGSTFTGYTVWYGYGVYPTNWTMFQSSSIPVHDTVLANWYFPFNISGYYSIRLTVTDTSGFTGEDRAVISVNPPSAPSVVYVDDDYTILTPGWGIDHFAKIQDGISAVNASGTVFVSDGMYYQGIVIDKQIDLVGDGSDTTMIYGSGNDSVVYVYADVVSISGFSIQNSGTGYDTAGIVIYSKYNTIINNSIVNNEIGISLDGSYCNKIASNTISNNYWGIWLCGSTSNTITSNTISNNQHQGIILDSSCNNNTIVNNTISNNNYGIYLYDSSNSNTIVSNNILDNQGNGIYLYYSSNSNTIVSNNILDNGKAGICFDCFSSNNTITSNNISNNHWGIWFYISNSSNTIASNNISNNQGDGIYLWESSNNTIASNTISNNLYRGIYLSSSCSNTIVSNTISNNQEYGIRLYNFSSNNTITSNNISNNQEDGIWLYGSSSNNTIASNTISNNNRGICLDDSSNDNRCYLNNFINNSQNACDFCTNIWDDGTRGNYWDDYTGSDGNGDGIGDTPYLIPGGNNKDQYPLMSPFIDAPPEKPNRPSGPLSGTHGIEYQYSSSTVDPDEDQVFYMWDWGDGSNSGWLGPYNSGATCEAKHIWNVKNNYNIKVMAKDIYGKESSWSDPLPIKMPYSYNKPILQFLELLFQRFLHAFPILRHLLGY